jgi:hypothetical protein
MSDSPQRVSTISTLKITFLGLQRFAPYKKLPSSRSHALVQPLCSLHVMIGCSPLEAYPLPGTLRLFSTEKDENVPPPYAAQQAPPPYSSHIPNNAMRQPRTRSIPFGSGVTMEWSPEIPQSPDDIVLVTVRLHRLGRRGCFDGNLPQR